MQANAAIGVAQSPRIAALFAVPVAAAELCGPAQLPPLGADELALLGDAVPKRRQEFAAGRACARHALAALGAGDAALQQQPGAGPRWPAGYCGSISHTQGLYGAVACRSDVAASLGLDLERRAPLEREVLQQVATAAERAWLASLPEAEAAALGMALFCAKEAFYKCQHPLTGRWLDFHDVCLRLHPDGRAELPQLADGDGGWIYSGRYRVEADYVLSGFQARKR